MVLEMRPDTDEVRRWLLSTLRHSCRVEYYLHNLDLGQDDPDRPHDIAGPGSKYAWDVIKGLALQYRGKEFAFQYPSDPEKCRDTDVFKEYVLPSIELHRNSQHHHITGTRPNPFSTPEDLKVAAVDTICSRLDDREYQGGAHTFEQLVEIIKKNDPKRAGQMWPIYSLMKKLPSPDVDQIISIHEFPNVGIPEDIYAKTVELTRAAVIMLKKEQGYLDI
ncbi:MAG: hypothetical protein V1729_05830 [Candidatus Woesearchaeota archaeon]